MTLPNRLKTLGYVVSSMSVILLGLVSWRAASHDLVLLLCLVDGMLAWIVGMILRWASYQLDE